MGVQLLSRVRPRAAVVITAAALLGLSQTTGSALGGFSATLSNSANSAASGTVAIAVTDSVGCNSTSASPGSTVSCPGSLFPATVPASSTSSRSSTISRTGLLDASSATLQTIGCGPVQLADTGSVASPLLPRWSTSFAVGGPLSGGAALGLDGSTGYAASTVGQNGGSTGLQTFSMGVWFKSSVTGAGNGRGSLLAFENAPVGSAASASDRILSMDAQGHLVFSVKTSSRLSVSSTGSYLDSAWHLAVATAKPSTKTITVSVDGQQSTFTNTSAVALASTNPGYFKLGLSATGTGVGVPGYWPGQLADAFVIPAALSAAQVTALSSAANTASQAAFAAAVAALSPSHFWPLSDDGSGLFTGTVPGLTGAAPCSQVAARSSVTSGGVTYCLTPTTNCTTSWGTIAADTGAIPPATAAASQLLSLTVSRVASGFDATTMPGLHILAPASVAESRSSFSTTLNWPRQAMVVQ
ncbi:MAG TPA: hypothetical protein VFD94_09450 [Jatrophihabitans sp.]|nr:hypothetical protein [Jatrophihabitans sp.]